MQKLDAVYQRGLRSIQGDPVFRRILTNSGWLLGANGISTVVGLVQGILVARALGVEQYGVLSIITTFTGVMGRVFDSRSWETSIRFVTRFKVYGDEPRALAVIKLGYLVDIASAVISLGLAWILAEWGALYFLKDVSYASALRIYAFVLLCQWSGGTTALLRVFDRFALAAQINAGMAILRLLCVVLVLYVWQLGLNGVLGVYLMLAVLSLAMGIALTILMVRRYFHVGWRQAPLSLLRGHRREIGRFLLSTNITASFKIVQMQLPTLVLGYLSNPTSVGYYRFGYGIAKNLLLIAGPVQSSVYPDFARLWSRKQVSQLKRVVLMLTAVMGVVAFSALVGALVFGRSVILLLVGEEFLASFPVLVVLFFANGLVMTTIWLGPAMLASGHAEHNTLAYLLGDVFLLLSLILLVPPFGAFGAGLAQISFSLGWTPTAVLLLTKSIRKMREENVEFRSDYSPDFPESKRVLS
ncbi:MAG TPA: hypothetical protein ENI39_00735 [Anaerolineae bacterium]|nr:hypothetical protein [Anaerolineae bacterium]